MKKQRKLQPKIERLFKALAWDYKKDIFKWSITLRESNIINSNNFNIHSRRVRASHYCFIWC